MSISYNRGRQRRSRPRPRKNQAIDLGKILTESPYYNEHPGVGILKKSLKMTELLPREVGQVYPILTSRPKLPRALLRPLEVVET